MSKRTAGHHAAAARHRRTFLYGLDHIGIDAVTIAFDGRCGDKSIGAPRAFRGGQQVAMPAFPVSVPVTRYVFDPALATEVLRSGFLELSLADAVETWAQEFIGAELPQWRKGYGLSGVIVLKLPTREIEVIMKA